MAGQETYGFDPAFERAVVALCCCRPRFFGRIGRELNAKMIVNPVSKLALEAVQAIGRDLGRGPSSSVLVIQRLRRWMEEGKVTIEQLRAVGGLLDDADDLGLPPEDETADEVAPLLKRRAQAEVVTLAINEYQKRGDFDRVVETLAKAQRVGSVDTSEGIRIGTASFSEIERLRHLKRLPTGVPELDAEMSGGHARAALGVIVGGPGDGKSMMLSHIAANTLLEGMSVLYATLELPEAEVLARLKANLTGLPINSILDGSMEKAKSRIAELEARLGIGYVQEFTAHTTTVADLGEWMSRCEDTIGSGIDLLIVDYADRLSAPAEKSEYQAMRVIYEDLRQLGVDRNCFNWTASQSSRQQKGSKRTDLNHVADSMHKVRIADLVITLNVKGDDSDLLEFYIAKHRTGRSRLIVGPLPTEFERGRIAPVLRTTGY